MTSGQNPMDKIDEISEKIKAAGTTNIPNANINQLSEVSVKTDEEKLAEIQNLLSPLQTLQNIDLKSSPSELLELTNSAIEQAITKARQ